MKTKKIIAVFLAFSLVLLSFAAGIFNAFALTTTLTENSFGIELVTQDVGYDDNSWFIFTPEQSGTYTLYGLSKNTKATEGYLFTKTTENHNKYYTQLLYSDSNPNYENYEDAASRQFCLTYHLDAGTTYYYAAGWVDPETTMTQNGRTIYVKFVCDSYDSDVLENIELSCDAELTWYTDGYWDTDENGDDYYYYNISKIINNMAVTLVYKDGSTLTSQTGATSVGGYTINYAQNQFEQHWYPEENELYTANNITVTVLDKSATYNVKINQGALATVKGKIIDDYAKAAIEGAAVSISGTAVATTDDDGEFSFVTSPGIYTVTISKKGALSRNIMLNVSAASGSNDHTENPVSLVTLDYNNDDIVNGKDYGYILYKLTSYEKESALSAFPNYSGFTSSDYEKITM